MKASELPGMGPYVGLVPFDAEHADYFFGRESESEVIAHNVLARPMTVLFGASGVGKSSVLNVGLPKALRELEIEARIALRREWSRTDELDWIRGLGEQVGFGREQDASGGQSQRLIVVLDQFEEFLYCADLKRARDFAKAVARCVARRDVEVHVLFSLRDYGLHRLEAIRSELPHLLEGTLELRRLDEAAAREAIAEPLKVWNERHGTGIELDPDFVETLIEQLRAADKLGGAGNAGAIDLSYLQLVLQRIWDYEKKAQGARFRRLRTRTLTTALRGVAGIARAHVNEVLDRLAPQDQALCPTLVDRLVTPSGGKVLYAASDLARVAKAPPGRMEAVAAMLAAGKSRLLREVPLPGSTDLRGYEIQHEVLAKPFLDWLAARQRAQAARRRYTRFAIEFVVFAAIVLGLSAWLLDRHERTRRDTFLTTDFAPPDAGRERRLLSHLFLLWERESQGARSGIDRASEIVKLEKEGRLPLDRSEDPVVADLADKDRPSWGSILLACMGSWLERLDFGKAEQARNALVQTGDDAPTRQVPCGNWMNSGDAKPTGRNAEAGKAKEAIDAKRRRAQEEWDSWLLGTAHSGRGESGNAIKQPQALNPRAARQEALALLSLENRGSDARAGRDSPGSTSTRLPIVHVRAAKGPAGVRVVAVADDLTVRVWEAKSGAPVAVRTGCEAKVFDASLSEDGNLLAAACADGTVRLWDLVCGDVEVLRGDTGVVRALAFSPDGTLLAAAARTGAVRIWRVRGSRDRTAPPDRSRSQDNRLPWKCGGIQKPKSEELRILRAPRGRALEVLGLAFNSRGTCIVTASQDQTARIWEVASGRQLMRLRGHSDWIADAAFSPDDTRVVTASYDGTARVWDWPGCAGDAPSPSTAPSGRNEAAAPPSHLLQGHKAQVYGAAFSPDGKKVVTASKDGTVRLWSVSEYGDARGQPLSAIKPSPVSAVFGSDNEVFAASPDGGVSTWDASTGQPGGSATLQIGVRRDAFVYPVHFDVAWKLAVGKALSRADEALLGIYGALSVENGEAEDARRKSPEALVVDLESQHPGSDHALAARAALQLVREDRDRDLITRLVRYDSNGKQATGLALDVELSRLIEDYRASYSRPFALLADRPHKELLTSVAFSPDRKRLATASYDGSVHFWERTGAGWRKSPARIEGYLDKLTSVAFSPDGQRVVTASYDGCARVWDWNDGKPRQRYGLQSDGPRVRPEAVHSARFSPDGKRVVTASRSGVARVWDLDDSTTKISENPKIEPCRARDKRDPGEDIVIIAASHVLKHKPDPMCVVPRADEHHRWASAAFSGDTQGAYVVAGAADGCARVWDWKREQVLQVLSGHTQSIHMVAFGPGSDKSVITASHDGTARIWSDWHRPSDVTELGPGPGTGEGEEVAETYHAAFSPDGNRVVTASTAGAHVWLLVAGKSEAQGERPQPVAILQGDIPTSLGPVYAAAWDPDQTRPPSIALAMEDGVGRVWNVGAELERQKFATDLNYGVACTLAESFPGVGCGKEKMPDDVARRDRGADWLLAETYFAVSKAAGPREPGTSGADAGDTSRAGTRSAAHPQAQGASRDEAARALPSEPKGASRPGAQRASRQEVQSVSRPQAESALRDLESKFPRAAQTLVAGLAIRELAPGEAGGGIVGDTSSKAERAKEEGGWLRRLALALDAYLTKVKAFVNPTGDSTEKTLVRVAPILAWPIWLLAVMALWPLWQRFLAWRGRSTLSSAAPNPIRRAWAGCIDAVLAIALGVVLGGLTGILASLMSGAGGLFPGRELHLGYRGWDLGLVVFVGVSSAYLLLRDAVKYQFRRSIGKLLFGLLPVTQGDAEIGVLESAKRNAFVVVVYLFAVLPGVALLVWSHWRGLPFVLQPVLVHLSESALVVPWQRLGDGGLAAAFVGLTLAGLVDLTLTCFGEGRTMRDRIAGTKVVSLWAEQPRDDGEASDAVAAVAAAAGA